MAALLRVCFPWSAFPGVLPCQWIWRVRRELGGKEVQPKVAFAQGDTTSRIQSLKARHFGASSATFKATFQTTAAVGGDCNGDVGGTPDCDVIGIATPLFGPHSGKQNIGGGGVHQTPIPLTFSAFLQTPVSGYLDGEGDNCFGGVAFAGILDIHKKTPNSDEARVSYWFTGRDRQTGDIDVKYSLSLSADFVDVTKWAPEAGQTAEIDGSSGTFTVANNNSPADLACKGTGSVNFSVVVELN